VTDRAVPGAYPGARLLADIGGTNARFAWQPATGEPLRDVASLPTREHATLTSAIRHYLAGAGIATPRWCAIGIANPVTGEHIQMTNHGWSFSTPLLQAELGFERLLVLNDFTAMALALPGLQSHELRQVGGTTAVAGAAMALIGPGTGLGVSGLLPTGAEGGWVPLSGEGGHVSLAPATPREAAALAWLRERHGHASAERAVSGPGLVALHQALASLDGESGIPALPGPTITARALAGADERCAEALALFCAFLGSVAGNLALTLGARGGVYIGGGIVPSLGEAFMRSPFRARFEDKGRFRGYLAAIPVFVIDTPISPALRGAARALDADPASGRLRPPQA
jgi:glucokinase